MACRVAWWPGGLYSGLVAWWPGGLVACRVAWWPGGLYSGLVAGWPVQWPGGLHGGLMACMVAWWPGQFQRWPTPEHVTLCGLHYMHYKLHLCMDTASAWCMVCYVEPAVRGLLRGASGAWSAVWSQRCVVCCVEPAVHINM